MASHVRWGLIVRIAAIAVLAPVVCLAAYVPIQQHILRWRAERLLADIRQIQMGKSTWAGAQRLMTKWGAWGKCEGSCGAEYCEYSIMLPDTLQELTNHFLEQTQSEKQEERHFYWGWELRLYSVLGGRISQIHASIRVKNGIIWTKSYALYTASSFYEYGVEEFLIGSAYGTTRFANSVDRPTLNLHPEYSLTAAGRCEGCDDGFCTVCQMIQAVSTPFANPGIVDQLFEFNLGCISNWWQCNEPKEIMPTVWRLYKHDRELLAKRSKQMGERDWARCDSPIDTLGRDYAFALLTEVAKIQTSPDSGLTKYVASLRGLKSLKNRAAFGAALLKEPLIGWSDAILPGGIRMAQLKPGSQIILLFEKSPDDRTTWSTYPDYCSYVPNTDENRAAIESGIARDALSDPN